MAWYDLLVAPLAISFPRAPALSTQLQIEQGSAAQKAGAQAAAACRMEAQAPGGRGSQKSAPLGAEADSVDRCTQGLASREWQHGLDRKLLRLLAAAAGLATYLRLRVAVTKGSLPQIFRKVGCPPPGRGRENLFVADLFARWAAWLS